jgi:lipopolysaccharide transport system permease protein
VGIPWKEIWNYKDLVYFLVRRDFIARYKQTILGPAWYVIQPLLVSVIFTVCFGKIAKIPTDGLPPMLFYLCGMLSWNYFSQCVSLTSSTFVTNAALFGKVYFPRFIIPLSSVCSNLIAFVIQFITFFAFWLYYRYQVGVPVSISPWVWCIPLLIVQVGIMSLGFGLWLSALSAKYRDLQHLNQLIISLWLYATPIIYPSSQLDEKWQLLYNLNPMVFVVEAFKFLLLGRGIMNIDCMMISLVVTLVVFFSGLFVFSQVEKTFIDTV